MFRVYPVFLLLLPGLLYAQSTISVDAITTMRVCGKDNAGSTGPCATAPRLINKTNPAYPEKARRKRKQGTVTLGLTVTKDGSTTGVHVVNGVDKDIDQAAIDAVSQWKFEPGTYQGNPVDVELAVLVNFRLSATPRRMLRPSGLRRRLMVVWRTFGTYTPTPVRPSVVGTTRLPQICCAELPRWPLRTQMHGMSWDEH